MKNDNVSVPFAKNLLGKGKKIYSQTIEDGVIEEIFRNIGTTNKYFIEFGCWDAVHLSNTANLRLNEGWNGLLLEGNEVRAAENDCVTQAFITADNINSIFEENNVPKEFDFMSIDIDGNDFWVWKAIDADKFDARVVIIEFNCNFADQYRSCAIKYSPKMDTRDPSIHYYSATIPALKKLGESKGYSLIFRVNHQNLVFVKTDLLHDDDKNIPLRMFLNKDGITPSRPANYDFKPKPHWNEYASSELTIAWDQDFKREWVEI